MGGFFDEYPLFFETSDTLPFPNRLNNRYEALIGRHRDILKGASVLDLASHDGRWAFAALKTGAGRVVGLEGQQVLVEETERTFKTYGVDASTYSFVQGDLFETVRDLPTGTFDVVLCFGFLHMHNRHFEMLHQVQRLAPEYLIMDVWVLPFTADPVTYLIPHIVDEDGIARLAPDFDHPLYYQGHRDYPSSARNGSAIKFGNRQVNGRPEVMLISQPSLPALEWLLAESGFGELDYYDWKNAPVDTWDQLSDYHVGSRVSLLAKNLR